MEEDVTKAAEVKTDTTAEEPIVKTPTKFDRSVMPKIGPDPEVNNPFPWKASLTNGMKIWGIVQNELPLVQYSIVIDGGHMLDKVEKAGVASLVAAMMNEGTKTKLLNSLKMQLDCLVLQ